jgi:GNAT superfamily N-acetyltransferase
VTSTPPRSRDLPGSRSNALVSATHTRVREADEHVVRYTPARLDYWSGNLLLLDRPPASASDSLERARGALGRWLARADSTPELDRVAKLTLAWECFDPRPLPDVFFPHGSSYTVDAVLRLAHPPSPQPTPPGLTFRSALRDADWSAIAQLVVDDWPDARGYDDFVHWVYTELRVTFARSRSTWWTAWHGPLLVGSLGLFESPVLRRFQELQTRASYRRRGVASTLIRMALANGSRAVRARETYIVASSGDAPERLYRSLGFEPCSWIHTLRVRRGMLS